MEVVGINTGGSSVLLVAIPMGGSVSKQPFKVTFQYKKPATIVKPLV